MTMNEIKMVKISQMETMYRLKDIQLIKVFTLLKSNKFHTAIIVYIYFLPFSKIAVQSCC